MKKKRRIGKGIPYREQMKNKTLDEFVKKEDDGNKRKKLDKKKKVQS